MNSDDDFEAFEAAAAQSAPAPAPAAVPLSQRAMAKVGHLYDPSRQTWFERLNQAQREAVLNVDGPLLMLAGAGTGKTSTLMARVAYICKSKRAQPWQVLAVTFTNKAAKEMKFRLGQFPYEVSESLQWMGTFHSISAKILRTHAELVGLKHNFTILDTDDQLRLLKQLIVARKLDDKRWTPRGLSGIIEDWKNRGLTPARVPFDENDKFGNLGSELYAEYQQRLVDLNAVDFGDLILHCVEIFRTRSDVLSQYNEKFKYIVVDEYQDTNISQYLWLRLLTQCNQNICCVGDDDQSIYGWRGAEVGNILKFEKDFPGAKVIRLEQNYRSTPHILAAASGVIRGNAERLGKTLWTDVPDGEKVRLIGHWDGEEEARWIGEEVESLQRGNARRDPMGLDSMAILVRASHQMRAFEDRFLTIGLPYRVIGGPRFYERLEIRDAMGYFRLAVSPDDDLAFERVVNTPKRGLGDKAVQNIQLEARRLGVNLLEGARSLLARGGITGKGAGQLRLFVENIDRWHKTVLAGPDAPADAVIEPVLPETPAANDLSHVRLAELILEESGYISMWQNDKTPEAEGRLENLKELVKALEQFDSLQGFLEHVSLVMENDSDEAGEKVSIMTLHAAKGLEFPVVFLPGWEEGLFPSQRSIDEAGLKGIEEERRLAYVGITRAEELCIISFASNRRVYGQWQSQMPGRFIDEMPAEHVEVLTSPGLMGGGYGAAAMGYGRSDVEERATRADVYNSPGWQRLQNNQAPRRSQAQPRRSMTIDAEALSAFTLGERVFNQKFGYGTILAMEGDTFEVDFEKAGVKHVKAGFVTAAAAQDEVPF